MKDERDAEAKLDYVAWVTDKSADSDAFDDFLGDKKTVQSNYSKFRDMIDRKIKIKE